MTQIHSTMPNRKENELKPELIESLVKGSKFSTDIKKIEPEPEENDRLQNIVNSEDLSEAIRNLSCSDSSFTSN